MTKEWSHLPNAEHINWVLDTLKKNPDVWNAATNAAWRAAWDASRAAVWSDSWNAARYAGWGVVRDASRAAAWSDAWNAATDAAWDAARVDVWGTAWDAIAALVAWDDSSELLNKSVEEVAKLGSEGNHSAILLLPAVVVKYKLKELENETRTRNEKRLCSSS
jgi:hypothetical protein